MNKFILIFLLISLCITKPVFSFDDEITHRDLTGKAIDASSLTIYLKNNLCFREGTSSVISEKTINWWLREGSYLEDHPMCRASNHFLNPLKSWDSAYMTDSPWWINAYCYSWSPLHSNVTWATGYLSQPPLNPFPGTPDAPKATFPNDDHAPNTWDSARWNYYQALVTPYSDARETYFARTFQAVGQVMHLLEDTAVPAHVRNDFQSHLDFHGITNANDIIVAPGKWFGNPFEFYIKNHPGLVASATPVLPSFASTRLTSFWDTDTYTQDTSILVFAWPLGLAEITNMNYFSDSTIISNIPSPEHYFRFPSIDSMNYQMCYDLLPEEEGLLINTLASTIIKKRKYISRKSKGVCPPVTEARTTDHFAALTFWSQAQSFVLPSNLFISNAKLYLDDNVHNTYAKELLPLAIGYSAELLNYFFRGTLEITPPDENVYAITDGSQTPYTDAYGNQHQQFTSLKAKIRNTTPNETIGAGTLTAVAKYRKRTDYKPDLSADPTEEHPEWGLYEPNFSYSVSASVPVDVISSTTPTEVTFTFPTNNPIPAGITDLYLQVVFKGTLGNEVENAVAVGFKDLAEPAHHVFWNLTDKFSLGQKVDDTTWIYHLYPVAAISDPTGTLIQLVDLNNNGIINEAGEPQIIDEHPVTYQISYLSNQTTEPPAVARVENLAPGTYIRLVIIGDHDQPRKVRMIYSSPVGSGTMEDSFDSVTNQIDYTDGMFVYTPVESFRKGANNIPIKDHEAFGLLHCYPEATEGTEKVCPYNEGDADPVEFDPQSVQILFGVGQQ